MKDDGINAGKLNRTPIEKYALYILGSKHVKLIL